jgi:hypothetical protein
MELSEIFWTFVISSCIAFVLAMARMAYRSKCENVECCGCIKITRNISAEIELDEREPPSPRPENNNSQRV